MGPDAVIRRFPPARWSTALNLVAAALILVHNHVN
jgi:hypothetical protein